MTQQTEAKIPLPDVFRQEMGEKMVKDIGTMCSAYLCGCFSCQGKVEDISDFWKIEPPQSKDFARAMIKQIGVKTPVHAK